MQLYEDEFMNACLVTYIKSGVFFFFFERVKSGIFDSVENEKYLKILSKYKDTERESNYNFSILNILEIQYINFGKC